MCIIHRMAPTNRKARDRVVGVAARGNVILVKNIPPGLDSRDPKPRSACICCSH